MSLREKIADIIWKQNGYYYDRIGSLKSADAILALVREHEGEQPSGLVAVKECDYCGGVHSCVSTCDKCHGSDRIVRPLSIKEALEWVKKRASAEHLHILEMDGERVEVEK